MTAIGDTITGSRTVDRLAFALAAIFIVHASGRLRVYYAVTVVDVQLVRVAADGTRRVLPTPAPLRTRGGLEPPRVFLRTLRRRIRAYMRTAPLAADAAPPADVATAARYEWVVRYGSNTTTPTRRHVFASVPARPDA